MCIANGKILVAGENGDFPIKSDIKLGQQLHLGAGSQL